MNTLGFSCYTHDSAAALIQEGCVVCACEEERFTRVKHTHEFPGKAIEYALSFGNISVSDLNHVAFHMKPWSGMAPMAKHFLRYAHHMPGVFLDALKEKNSGHYESYRHLNQLTSPRTFFKDLKQLSRGGKKSFQLHFVEHHLAHNASAFYVSPFEEAACLSLDGVGEWATAMTAIGRGNKIQVLQRVQAPHSIGMLYNSICEYLGFSILDGPGKVMGLSSYGDRNRYLPELKQIVQPLDNGLFRLDMRYFNFHLRRSIPRCSQHFNSVFGAPRQPSSLIEQRHKDLAAGLQQLTEDICFHILKALRERTQLNKLCLSGGVALNSVMNGAVVESGLFDEIYIQPAAGDSGTALGAALFVEHQILGRPRPGKCETAFLGARFSDEEIAKAVQSSGLTAQYVERPEEVAADHLAEGKIIGWFQGAAEFGPRALGNRSILTAPFPAEMKEVLNLQVKHREEFRPFAPAILAEHHAEYFEGSTLSPYMMRVQSVRRDKRKLIPAVTHVDGTGRVQTVDKNDHPTFYDLIKAFHVRTGIPVVLNTSFNVQGMPIVNTPEEAIDCFKNTNIDMLIIGNYVIKTS